MGHSSTLYGTNLYIFGGVCNDKYFNSVYVLDLSSMAWHVMDVTGPAPTPRMGHTATLMDHNLVIHGGFALTGEAKNEAVRENFMELILSKFTVVLQ
jgi:N-acetylneuraminic acid mutarotase